jgi:alkanesulfonate monooxygenase SsuD/methylene tetrahydromethanopterin reductase-like flavin-dependent oxidoreductase (luciferase family)
MVVSINVTAFPEGDVAGHLAGVVDAAEAAGIDTVWVGDHLLQVAPGTSEDDPMLEAYTTLGFLAARSSRVRLGTMVAGATFRATALLLKAVHTLDALSGGRAWLGVGTGYNQREADAMGLFLPPVRERYAILEQLLRLHASNDWRPRSCPPILIGGMGERRTLRLVAEYADACNLFDIPDGGRTVTHKLQILREHCEAVGRPYDAIAKTLSTRADDPGWRDRLSALGIGHAVVITDGPWTPEAIAALA